LSNIAAQDYLIGGIAKVERAALRPALLLEARTAHYFSIARRSGRSTSNSFWED